MKTLAFLFLAITLNSNAETIHPEMYYQDKWCSDMNGCVMEKLIEDRLIEHVLHDRTRVDCLLDLDVGDRIEKYAVEVDFAKKWAESIGQSLHYAEQTNRQPGILIIIEKESDYKHLYKLYSAIKKGKLDIRVWVIKP